MPQSIQTCIQINAKISNSYDESYLTRIKLNGSNSVGSVKCSHRIPTAIPIRSQNTIRLNFICSNSWEIDFLHFPPLNQYPSDKQLHTTVGSQFVFFVNGYFPVARMPITNCINCQIHAGNSEQ